MSDRQTAADELTCDTETILATRPGLAALRTSSCPSIARCVEVYTNPRSGWTDQERQHFRSCPYCFEVGSAMAKASARLARKTAEHEPQTGGLKAAIRRIIAPKGRPG